MSTETQAIAEGDVVVNPSWPERKMTVERIAAREGIAQCVYFEGPKLRRAYHGIAVLGKVEA